MENKEQKFTQEQFIELIKFRDIWRQGWEPSKKECGFGFWYEEDIADFHKYNYEDLTFIFSFQTELLRNKFLMTFREKLLLCKDFVK